jgi:hypothetical protein
MSKRINWISPEEELAEILEAVNPVQDDDMVQNPDFDIRNSFLNLIPSSHTFGSLSGVSVVWFCWFFSHDVVE